MMNIAVKCKFHSCRQGLWPPLMLKAKTGLVKFPAELNYKRFVKLLFLSRCYMARSLQSSHMAALCQSDHHLHGCYLHVPGQTRDFTLGPLWSWRMLTMCLSPCLVYTVSVMSGFRRKQFLKYPACTWAQLLVWVGNEMFYCWLV